MEDGSSMPLWGVYCFGISVVAERHFLWVCGSNPESLARMI